MVSRPAIIGVVLFGVTAATGIAIASFGFARSSRTSSLVYYVQPPPPSSISISANPTHVWANGHQSATITARYTPGHQIILTASPLNGVTFVGPQTQTTDAAGVATFAVTSTNVASVTFTAADFNDLAQNAWTAISFDRHKIVVQLQGIESSVECNGLSCLACDWNGTNCSATDGFNSVRNGLAGFGSNDILWYSYTGGTIDASTGRWLPNNYTCVDTAQDYAVDIAELLRLLTKFGSANPNTDFYLVGHSQGGLIAFQALGLMGKLPPKTAIAGIFTLDSPLGGSPGPHVRVAALISAVTQNGCWTFSSGNAPSQLVSLWDTTTNHSDQGSTSTFLCSLLQLCPPATNADMVGQHPGLTYTYGNSDDAVYRPTACNVYVPLVIDNTSTEAVSGAGGGVSSLGGNTPLPPKITTPASLLRNANTVGQCVGNSHGTVLSQDAAAVSIAIGAQVGVAP